MTSYINAFKKMIITTVTIYKEDNRNLFKAQLSQTLIS